MKLNQIENQIPYIKLTPELIMTYMDYFVQMREMRNNETRKRNKEFINEILNNEKEVLGKN